MTLLYLIAWALAATPTIRGGWLVALVFCLFLDYRSAVRKP